MPDGGLDISLEIRDEHGNSFLPFAQYGLTVRVSAFSECAASDSTGAACSTRMDASKTVYVGLTELQSSTYAYAGVAAAVPEPATYMSLLLGLGLVAPLARRQRR